MGHAKNNKFLSHNTCYLAKKRVKDASDGSENGGINIKKKKARFFWTGITTLYLIIIATVIALDYVLHWGLLVGVIILALIHVFFIVGLVSCYTKKRKQ